MSGLTDQLDNYAITQDIAREFRQDAAESKRLEAENRRLRAALEPFANVADWMDRMLSLDRYVSMRGVTFHADSSVIGGGFTIGENEFRVARAALAPPLPTPPHGGVEACKTGSGE